MSDAALPKYTMRRLSLWGAWLAMFTLIAMVAALGYMAINLMAGHDRIVQELIADFDLGDLTQSLTLSQRIVGYVFWVLPDVLGGVMIFTAWRLFRGFRHQGVLVPISAKRLRNIGWCIFAIAPVRIIGETLGTAFIAYTNTPSSGRIHLSLEEIDLYAVIIGLIIVASGQIMAQAIEISEENRSFV